MWTPSRTMFLAGGEDPLQLAGPVTPMAESSSKLGMLYPPYEPPLIVTASEPSKMANAFAVTSSTFTLRLQGPTTTPACRTACETSSPRTTTSDTEANSRRPVSSTFAFGAASKVTVPPREPVIRSPGYSPPATATTSPGRATAKARASVLQGRAVVQSPVSEPFGETASRGATAECAEAGPNGWPADVTPATMATDMAKPRIRRTTRA